MEYEDFISCIECLADDHGVHVDIGESGWKKDWESGKDPHEAFYDVFPDCEE